MPELALLIKPASSLCNMRCKYCFYRDEAEKREVGSRGIMSGELSEIIIRRALEETGKTVSFAFQGGEPTMAGFDYFEHFIETAGHLNTRGVMINYTIQTNGCFDEPEKWAGLFKKADFLVGLSFDGTRELHDFNRVDANGRGSAAKVMHCAAIFDRVGVKYNILTVVTPAVARKIRSVFAFYEKNGWIYQQYINCLPPLGEADNASSLDSVSWLSFNKALFDLWYAAAVRDISFGMPISVSIRHFDDYIRAVAGLPVESCGSRGICAIQNVIEADGSVYPCDFYALDEYKLGNVRDMSFRELYECGRAQDFIKSSACADEKCAACEWRPICLGGCRRSRENGLYRYCEASGEFYRYTFDRARALASKLRPE